MIKIKVVFSDNSTLLSYWDRCPNLGDLFMFYKDNVLYSIVEISEDKEIIWVEDMHPTIINVVL